jgi:RNA polymerase sigma factor (sigma-70 family)
VLSGELDGLCIVAGELEPALTHSAAASACGFLSGGAPRLDDCFSALMKNTVPEAKQKLRRASLNPYDVEDAIMKALLATCTREPPPDKIVAYFFTVASNQLRQIARDARRTVSCDQLDDQPDACRSSEPLELREAKLAELWNEAICRLSDDAAKVVRRRLEQDEDFEEIGKQLGMPKARARDTFYNAIKRLRTLGLASCDYDWF